MLCRWQFRWSLGEFFWKSAAWAKQQRRFRSFLLFFSGKGPIAPVQYSCMQAPGPIWAPRRNLQFLTFLYLVSNHLCIFRQNISCIILPPGLDTGFTVSFDTRGLGSGRWETQKTPNLDDWFAVLTAVGFWQVFDSEFWYVLICFWQIVHELSMIMII